MGVSDSGKGYGSVGIRAGVGSSVGRSTTEVLSVGQDGVKLYSSGCSGFVC